MASTSWKDLIGKAEPAQDFTPLPPGTYDVEVESAEYKATSTGKDMYMLTFKVTQGAHAGRKLWNNIVISPESPTALGIAFRDLATLGVTEEFLLTEPDHPAICAKMIGSAAKASVIIRADDNTRNDIKGIRPAEGADAFAAPASSPGGSAAPPNSPF